MQREATRHLGLRELAAWPSRSIVYHEPTGNLVVPMGLEGVVVGTPDGEWSRLAVGPYEPTDYSFAGKLRHVASSDRLWAAAIGLSVCLTAVILALHLQGENRLGLVVAGALAPLVLASFLVLMLYPAVKLLPSEVVAWYMFGFIPVAFMAAIVGEVVIGLRTKEHNVRKSLALAVGILSVPPSLLLPLFLLNYGTRADESYINVPLFFGSLALVFSLASIVISWRFVKHRPVIIRAAAAMVLCFTFSILAAVLSDIDLGLACLFGIALVLLVAVLLSRHMEFAATPS